MLIKKLKLLKQILELNIWKIEKENKKKMEEGFFFFSKKEERKKN